jgi:serine/threonine protein kinase
VLDIKPQNVFLDAGDQLILGDFGLVFFADDSHTRLSGTLENVGTRDWMPPWAVGKRLEDVTPAFDVFALGKLFWSMISGLPLLPYWWYDRPEYDVTQLFRRSAFMPYANVIFQYCIVDKEKDCKPHARLLLEMVDDFLYKTAKGIDLYDANRAMSCKVCGRGFYDKTHRALQLTLDNGDVLDVLLCNNCGNAQLFDPMNETV